MISESLNVFRGLGHDDDVQVEVVSVSCNEMTCCTKFWNSLPKASQVSSPASLMMTSYLLVRDSHLCFAAMISFVFINSMQVVKTCRELLSSMEDFTCWCSFDNRYIICKPTSTVQVFFIMILCCHPKVLLQL